MSSLQGDKEQLALTLISQGASVDPITGQLIIENNNYVWDPVGLAWVKETQPGGGGGGGGAVTVADGADVTQGATTDAAVSTDAAGTVNAHLRGLVKLLAAPLHAIIDSSAVLDISDRVGRLLGHVNVDNFPATQPVSLATGVDVTDRAARLVGVISNANIDVALSTRLKPADTLAAVTTLGSITNALPAGTNLIGKVELDDGAGTSVTVGQKAMAGALPVVVASDQSAIPVSMAAASVLFRGRISTFRTPGRAGTVGQKIMSLHNATGSTVKVYVTKIVADLVQTAVKAVTVLPPVIRLWKVTVLPTNGTALTKNQIGGTTTSNASVTALGDASADGTGSGTTLTATLPAGAILTQEFAPRLITAAGYEMADRVEFNLDGEIELDALQGVVLFLDYVLATQNPTTDMWIASAEWYEK